MAYSKLQMRIYQREWTHTPNRQAYLKKYRQTEEYKKSHRKTNYKWIRNNKEKVKAHSFVKRYNLIRNVCEFCGKDEVLHAHHPDYSEPKKIITLCALCHSKIHYG
jgi:hypothetical protein